MWGAYIFADYLKLLFDDCTVTYHGLVMYAAIKPDLQSRNIA